LWKLIEYFINSIVFYCSDLGESQSKFKDYENEGIQ
jgi:hypothetical protein